jgi:hypothetical protein
MGGDEMRSRRLLTVGPDDEPLWVRLYVHQVGEAWAAMILVDEALPPEPGSPKGTAFFGETQEVAEEKARAYLRLCEPAN